MIDSPGVGTMMEEFAHSDYQRGPSENMIPITAPVVVAVSAAIMKDLPPHLKCPWHSSSHLRTRETMKQCILHLIRQRKSNPCAEWLEIVPDVCAKVEQRLYFAASDFEEYNNPHTLLDRLLSLVQNLALGRICSKSTPNPKTMVDEISALPKKPTDPKLIKPKPKQLITAASRQVSSQGCSRVFIGKVLHRVCGFVQGKKLPSIFTFPKELVMSWLEGARQDCIDCDLEFEESYYGGPPFLPEDPTTHWSEPHQLYTWWKNNVERKTKFSIIVGDSGYTGVDERRVSRAHWCKMVVCLSEKIRKSAGSGVQSRALMRGVDYTLDKKSRKSFVEGSRESQSRNGSALVMGGETCALDKLLAAAEQLENCSSDDNISNYGSDDSRGGKKRRGSKGSVTAKKGRKGSSRIASSAHGGYRTNQPTFPLKLFDLITSQPLVISWLNEGTSFQIRDMNLFVEVVLPKYFKHKNFTSFQRQLNLYGFRRTKEADKGVYYHPHFIDGRRDMAARIRRLLNGQIHSAEDDELGAESEDGMVVEVSSENEIVTCESAESSPRGMGEDVVERKRAAGEAGEGDMFVHAYGTRRKRSRKKYSEFVTDDDEASIVVAEGGDVSPRTGDGFTSRRASPRYVDEDNVDNDDAYLLLPSNAARRRASTVSSIEEGNHYDEIIDMRAVARRPRRAMTKTIRIDMRPINDVGGKAIVSQSTVINAPRIASIKTAGQGSSQNSSSAPLGTASASLTSALNPIQQLAEASSFETVMQRTQSHSKCTRVGDEYQAELPALLRVKSESSLENGSKVWVHPVADDTKLRELMSSHRALEIDYVRKQGAVITALLPPPSSRNSKKLGDTPEVVLADSQLRNVLLKTCHQNDPSMHHTYMPQHAAKLLCPRICITLQTLTLIRGAYSQDRQFDDDDIDGPVLHLLGENGEAYMCELWGVNFCKSASDSSSDEDDIFTTEPHVCSVMSKRYMGVICDSCGNDMRSCAHMNFVQVHDGVQDWIVPISCCAPNGSLDHEEAWLDSCLKGSETTVIVNKTEISVDKHNLFAQWTASDVTALRRSFRKYGRSLYRVWKDFNGLGNDDTAEDAVQTTTQDARPLPSVSVTFREFVDFCHQMCPLPSGRRSSLADIRSDGRIQAARRLQYMLERVETFWAEEGDTTAVDTSSRSEKEEGEEGGSEFGSSDETMERSADADDDTATRIGT